MVTLSKMNNQKAHTEGRTERGGQFVEAKCHHLLLTNNRKALLLVRVLLLVFKHRTGRAIWMYVRKER